MEIYLKDRLIDHVITFYEASQDPEIKKMFPSSIKSQDQALALFQASKQPGASSYGQVIYCGDTYIGDVWIYAIDRQAKHAMISFVIFDKSYWGRGLASKASELFISKVKEDYDLDKLGAFTFADNLGSIGVLSHLGFKCVDTMTEGDRHSFYYVVDL